MATMTETWVKHPGYYIKEEMEARGWSQRDLAFILGSTDQALNPILSGKRGISPEMAKAFGEAFDVPAEFSPIYNKPTIWRRRVLLSRVLRCAGTCKAPTRSAK